jgi:esterase/lipase
MEDSLTTIKNAKVVCDVMQANEKEVVLLSGCDHVLTLDLRKKDVADFIGKFVIKTSWQAQGGRVAILNGTANE